MKSTMKQAVYAYRKEIGYNVIEAGGLFRVYGRSLAAHHAAGGIVMLRLNPNGTEATWTHGLGINTPRGRENWVEVRLVGSDPFKPESWEPTGRVWPVGTEIAEIR